MNEREALRNRLITVARSRTTISYKEAGAVIGKPAHGIWRILDEISRSEHKQDKPMLPAVVIVSQRGVPGYGFFTMAKKLGKPAPDPNETDSIPVQRGFWERELDRVYKYWSQQGPSA